MEEDLPVDSADRDILLPVPSRDPARLFAHHLKTLLDGLGLTQREYARRYHYDASTISRFLSGKRLPDRAFVEQLLGATEELHGAPVTPQLREHTRRLFLDALRVRNPAQHRIQMLTDQLAEAELRLRQAVLREQAVLDQLETQQRRVDELDRELLDLIAARDSDRAQNDAVHVAYRQAEQRLEDERDELLRTIADLDQDLRHAHEQRQQAEADYEQAERALDMVEQALRLTSSAGSGHASSAAPRTVEPAPLTPLAPPLGAGGFTAIGVIAFFIVAITSSALMSSAPVVSSSAVRALPASLALGWLGGSLAGLSLNTWVAIAGRKVRAGRVITVDVAVATLAGLMLAEPSMRHAAGTSGWVSLMTALAGAGWAVERSYFGRLDPNAPWDERPFREGTAMRSLAWLSGDNSRQYIRRPAWVYAAGMNIANGTRPALVSLAAGILAALGTTVASPTLAEGAIITRVLVATGYLIGISGWLYSVFSDRPLLPQGLRPGWRRALLALLAGLVIAGYFNTALLVPESILVAVYYLYWLGSALHAMFTGQRLRRVRLPLRRGRIRLPTLRSRQR